MAKYYYRGRQKNYKLVAKFFSLTLIALGGVIFFYTFFPLISWHIYFAPAMAASKFDSPIPSYDLITNADYTNADNWYPEYRKETGGFVDYTISIPKINVLNARVTNKNPDLTKHLVQFNSDSKPPNPGNSVIFGHSTLPQLYEADNYKTILSNAYKLNAGDIIIVETEGNSYNYVVKSITIADASDTSSLSQNFSDSYLTIITCTPPGTTWKRLIIKAGRQD